MSDSAPIVETEFVYGTNVIDIGDLRVARGMTRREFASCRHLRLIYDKTERRVWCSDCERPVESFDAFVQLVDRHGQIEDRISRLREADRATIFSRAAKVMDKAFRSKNMAPCCPHCNHAILAADVATGVSLTNKDWESRRRAQKDKS